MTRPTLRAYLRGCFSIATRRTEGLWRVSMECGCGKQAVHFGHCTVCWIRLTNYRFYLDQKEKNAEEVKIVPPKLPTKIRYRAQ